MRFLANENVPAVAVEALRAEGYDTAWIRTDAPGSSDADVLVRAVKEERILLTFDKDFGDLVFHCGAEASRGIVLFRIPMISPRRSPNSLSRPLEHAQTGWTTSASSSLDALE